MNYSDVVALALSYADRQDDEVVDRIDNFLLVVESRINRKLKTKDMTVRSRVTLTEGEEYYALPDDFAGTKDAEYLASGDSSVRLTAQYVSPEQMNNYSTKLSAGDYTYSKVYYTIVANQFQILPAKAGLFEIVYYQKLPNLKTVTTNWLSEAFPDCYLFGLMVEINAFIKDAQASALWEDRFAMALEEIETDDNRQKSGGTALQTRVG